MQQVSNNFNLPSNPFGFDLNFSKDCYKQLRKLILFPQTETSSAAAYLSSWLHVPPGNCNELETVKLWAYHHVFIQNNL